MKPIVAQTQLSFKRYYSINLYMLLRRKVMWILFALAVLLLLSTLVIKYQDNSIAYLGLFYLVFASLMPGLIYYQSKKMYRKVTHMSEPKTYEFSEDGIKLSGETVKMETTWANISKAIKRPEDYLLFSINNRAFFSLPTEAFNADEIGLFEELVRSKIAKRNF